MEEEASRARSITLAQDPDESRESGIRGPSEDCCNELDEARRELDEFLYAVSHDLGAPLRAIQGFSRLLLEQYAERLDAKGQDYLARMQAASRKIDQMIDDLLQISRLARGSMKVDKIDLSRIARKIAEQLHKSAPKRSVKFIVAEDIRAVGDERLVAVVLENLLGNAWKFTRKKEGAVIEFGVAQDGREPVYFVRDNGIGFAHTEIHRIFKPFQKLHNDLEYPGSGIGLTKVSRLIRRFGGEIRAESEEGKGTTIFFTLGAHPAALIEK